MRNETKEDGGEPAVGAGIECLDRLLQGPRSEHYVLRVVGDRLEGRFAIMDGDYLVIRRAATAEPGDLAVIGIGSAALTLERYQPTPDGKMLVFEPSLQPGAVSRVAAEDVQIRGIVVGVMRKLERGKL